MPIALVVSGQFKKRKKMRIGFDNINEHIVKIDDFQLKWRFTEEKYDLLPELHLKELSPLDKTASKFLSDYISNSTLFDNTPFKKDFFKTIDRIRILENNEKEIKKWLYKRGFPFNKQVYLSWDDETAMIVPWKLVIKYFDSFYYRGSDDLTIFDQSLNWAIVFFHYDDIYFGSNNNFTIDESEIDIEFI